MFNPVIAEKHSFSGVRRGWRKRARWLCAVVGAALLFALLFACGGGEDERTRAFLVGTWEKENDVDKSFLTERRFEADGTFRTACGTRSEAPMRATGAFRVVAEGTSLRLETCTDGATCRTGGLWTIEELTAVGDDRMMTRSPNGGSWDLWTRTAR